MFRPAMFLMIAVLVFVALADAPARAQARQTASPKTPPTSPSAPPAQAAPVVPAKQIKRDEVFFAIERIVSSKNNDAGVSGITAELDGVIEITSITYRTDGKAEVTIKERTPSSAAFTNKSTQLVFTPPATGEKWTWAEFKDGSRFYVVDRLFPFAQIELSKRKQATTASWNTFLGAIAKQGEAASKALDTAKALLKAEPPQVQPILAARKALAEATKESKYDDIIAAYNDLSGQSESVLSLGDTYTDLKANDAYLRLIDEFKNSVNVTNATRKNYVQSVDAYNELLVRLPFALVAYGLQYTRIEAKVTAE
ncbi:MAG: LemA family protein [Acidobacteriota bacterium]|nr:LemA family protein [Acidobacteriota bacterium]